jgi:hypothetical protein
MVRSAGWPVVLVTVLVSSGLSAQEVPTVPPADKSVLLVGATDATTPSRLTQEYLTGNWAEFLKLATPLVESALKACLVDRKDPSKPPVCPGPKDGPRFDLQRDYVQLLWMATLPTAKEPTVLSALVHTPATEPYARVIPGLKRGSAHRLFELFVNDATPPQVASYYVSKPLPDPLLTEAPAVTEKFLGPLFTFLNAVDPARLGPLDVGPRLATTRYFLLNQVDLPEARATIEMTITARLPLSPDGLAERLERRKSEVLAQGLLTEPWLLEAIDGLSSTITRAASACGALDEAACRGVLHAAVVSEAARRRPALPSDEARAAFLAVEKSVRQFVDMLAPETATAKLQLENSPLRHLTFGLVTSFAAQVYGTDQRAKVDGGKVVAAPLPRVLNMVVLNVSPAGYQAKTSQRVVRGWPALRAFTGVVFAPDVGVAVGGSWAILPNLGVNVGYARLFVTRPDDGLTIGAVLDEKVKDDNGNPTSEFVYSDELRRDPLQRGRLGALFVGVSFNFK